MKESEIKTDIERVRGNTNYSSWTIGITDNPTERKSQHGNTTHWHQWRADTEAIARNVEKHFLDKGMKGATGGGDSTNYVYIF